MLTPAYVYSCVYVHFFYSYVSSTEKGENENYPSNANNDPLHLRFTLSPPSHHMPLITISFIKPVTHTQTAMQTYPHTYIKLHSMATGNFGCLIAGEKI